MRAQGNGRILRAMAERPDSNRIALEILEGEDLLSDQLFFTELYNALGDTMSMENRGIEIQNHRTVPVKDTDVIRLKVKVPALKKGQQIGVPSLLGRVIRNVQAQGLLWPTTGFT
jgi:hypothetical protein